jgi:predicted dinucleotide-binding enzyme
MTDNTDYGYEESAPARPGMDYGLPEEESRSSGRRPLKQISTRRLTGLHTIGDQELEHKPKRGSKRRTVKASNDDSASSLAASSAHSGGTSSGDESAC